MSASQAATGGFFAIDRRAWAHACEFGINAMTAYLVLARGAGRDQRTTSWSVNAIEEYTGIGRQRARQAVNVLEKSGLIRVVQTGIRPRYHIVPAHEVHGCEGYPPLPRINYDVDAATKPDWIWLPNAIVDGAGGNLCAPVELVRQTQNASALRLLIDLYYAHTLQSDGGIHWRSIRQDFARHTVGQHGPFIIYGFQPGRDHAWPDKPPVRSHMTGKIVVDGGGRRDRGWPIFWKAWEQLKSLGLVELIGHLVEADNDTAGIIHPYAVGNGEAAERLLAASAHAAANALLTEGQREWAEDNDLRLAPIRAHISEVQMVGIARMRYRPRTSATSAWFARMAEWEEMADRYDVTATEAARADAPPNVQHQGR